MGARLWALFAVLLLLTGCPHTDVRVYEQVDRSDRSMTVPAGGSGLLGELKSALRQDGWRMAIDRGPTVARGSGPDVRIADTFNTRYRLYVDWRRTDLCFSFDAEVDYDISVVDNQTGAEVLTLSGRDCEGAITTQFINALR